MARQTRSQAPTVKDTLENIANSPYGEMFFSVLKEVIVSKKHSQRTIAPRDKLEWQQLVELLDERGTELNLFAVMRLIENVRSDLPRIGTSKRIKEDAMRFGQVASLNFAPSEIANITRQEKTSTLKLKQYGFGLLGPNGPMPNHLTEYAHERVVQHKDSHLVDFLDVFNHRALSLFYRAWANAQPVVELDRPDQNHFSQYIASLCGLNLPALHHRDEVPDATKLAHAGLLSRHVRNPEGLKAILTNYFNIKVNIITWVGYWMQIPPSQQTRIGKADGFCQLGVSTMLGSKIWDIQSSFRILLGPLNHQRYLDFLPNGQSLKKLKSLVKLYIGEEYRFQLQLVLKKDEVPMNCLGSDVRLGWTSWLGVRLSDSDAIDYVI